MKGWLALAERAIKALERIAAALEARLTLDQKIDMLTTDLQREKAMRLPQEPAHLVVIGGGPCWCGKVHDYAAGT